MPGTESKDNATGDGSSPSEGMTTGLNCQAGDLLAEWRSSEQVENDTPSTSPPYWDTDDGDDDGPKPSELYGKFTWKVENFSQISKRELRSNAFEVGGYKWYILIYPQGCDVCNHLSLFLCVANHDRLLPGWSHFAQFTIAVVNKDPKKSKYSDTLHRFWKKEHDWGWKKFMELSKIVDGFIEADTLVIKAQVQVIREKANRPFRCLDRQYMRELARVYLSNVENICRRFVEERRGMLCKLMEDRVGWSGLHQFWIGTSETTRKCITRDKTEAILKVIVKHFFVEKEVTSTLVMDSLYSGMKALEWQSENKKGTNISAENEEMAAPTIHIVDDMFILARDALVLLEMTALEPLPPKDEKSTQSQNQNRTKDGSSSEEFSKDSVERDEKRLTELGRRTLEIFVLTHIFSSKIEVAYQEVVALKRQEELIREEEAAGQAEHELRAKRNATEKEKRAKKKQGKQKRNNRKGKERCLTSKPNQIATDLNLLRNSYDEKTLEDFAEKSEGAASEKIEIHDVSDASDTGAEVTDAVEPCLDIRIWDTDASEVLPVVEASNNDIQNDQSEKKCRSAIDDSSSTCSTESAPSVVMPVANMGNLSPDSKDLIFSSRGRNRRKKVARHQTSQNSQNPVKLSSDAAPVSGHLQEATNHSRTSTPETDVFLLNDQEQDDLLQNKQNAIDLADQVIQAPKKESSDGALMKPCWSRNFSSHCPSSENGLASSQQSKQGSDDFAQPNLDMESSDGAPCHPEKSTCAMVRPCQSFRVDKLEMQKLCAVGKVAVASGTSPLSRPASAPLVPDLKPTASVVSSVPALPILSRSVSAFGRLSAPEAPTSTHNHAPLSYRNATIGKAAAWSDSLGYQRGLSSSSKGSLYTQPATVVTVSSTDSCPAWPDQIPTRPTSSFNSVNTIVLVGGDCGPARRLMHEPGCNVLTTSSFVNDARCPTEELTSGSSDRQFQGSAADEFPHLDIINYLLDEDSVDAKSSSAVRTCFRPSLPYGASGCQLGADVGPSNTSCQLDGRDQYYGDMSNGLSDSSIQAVDGGRELLSLEADSPSYTRSGMDGWMFSQWPLGGAGNSVLSGSGTAECSALSYQLQDYSNLACSVSGYVMYPHANGF